MTRHCLSFSLVRDLFGCCFNFGCSEVVAGLRGFVADLVEGEESRERLTEGDGATSICCATISSGTYNIVILSGLWTFESLGKCIRRWLVVCASIISTFTVFLRCWQISLESLLFLIRLLTITESSAP